ncbi:MAG: Tol-Pal system beta propeller repeat protein TolB [Methylococcaceae bacterium]
MIKRLLVALCLTLVANLSLLTTARAELNVQITQGVEGAVPVAVVPFAQSLLPGENIGSIVAADLNRSGRFRTLPVSDMLEQPTAPEQVRFKTWQVLGQDNLVIGRITPAGGGHYEAEFFLYDAIRGTQLLNGKLPFAEHELRRVAHRIADIIYQNLTGEMGAFATRVAYVTQAIDANRNRLYRLQVADTDGFNPKSIISSPEPIMSPAWSPDGKQIAYVSFERKTSAIFVQTLATGERQKVSELPGINGAPAWSPDGSQLALTLSKDGNPDIYVLNLATRALRRITDHLAIDTEPNWSKDGKTLVFTSDRGGKPQLYLAPSAGGAAQRLTYNGDYNAGGVYSPDGRSIAMVHGNGGDYRIALMDLQTRAVRILSKGRLDESPGFAPNGSMILYASHSGGSAQLDAVSVDGKVHQSLKIDGGQVKEPAWSP